MPATVATVNVPWQDPEDLGPNRRRSAVNSEDPVQQVRAFNRFYTHVIGVLGDEYLHTRWTVTEARIIFELATNGETTAAELRRRLDLDRGYLSRIMAGLEAARIVTRERDPHDARLQRVRLTSAGQQEFKTLNRRSARGIAAMLAAQPKGEQVALLSAMATIRRILDDEHLKTDVELTTPQPGDFGWVIERNGSLYAQEYSWDFSFEALVADIVSKYLLAHDPEREAVWIARCREERLGSVFCVRRDECTAQLRLLLVEPWARRLGIGTALVDRCVEFARSRGFQRLVLWTNDVLVDARRIYERAGFGLEKEEPHHSFGADLVGQYWGLDL
jgi:DNA-binding MarR family transcriptional regulator/GNAT superfamily N-acetyltransferase